ncbi:hypothetical protein PMI14_05166 [Acidovorax sp. CF316]|uniref:hypothetical protein n=1 Tax=Acidovorax sp. CF316 TaxID=1144317 RepID=UPI00026BBFD9|nr:hypothetical protein [Acidovorax sp. CF316]EJE50250.1 hypothetical protein PMI14_05166 [Acidovorax sp. CF316]
MHKTAWLIGELALAGLATASVWAQQPTGPVGSIYTCTDRNGRKLTADRPIADCLDREQRELAPSGMVRRQVGPVLSEQERAVVEARQRKEAEERSRALEERRRERALTARYPDKAAHDVERKAAIQMVEDVAATAEKRLIELRQQRKTLDTEMEFYKKDPSKAPMVLRTRIAENEDSVAEQQRFIAGQGDEKRRVHQRFDVELAQLRKLWDEQRGVAVPGAATPASAGGSR